MESRKRELTRAHGFHTALKVKDSKTGQMILRGNVFEESKLEGEINQINHWQKKEATRLRWEKEYALKDLRKNLLKRGKSNPDVLSLPPITEGLSRKLERTRSDEKRSTNLAYLSSADSSPERSPYSSLEDMFAKLRLRERSSLTRHSETTSLPALISPQLMRKKTTTDPRFTNLMSQLVPKAEVNNDSENVDEHTAERQYKTQEDTNFAQEHMISDLEQRNQIQQ